ncbi:Glucosamine-phosphate N-acetyltransferase-like protein [Microbotryomycetes sp. JL201]|nr:Glucosamine-phosphate N-acetyltransferase-like protein [Microbotryomycetes sp. JL201]
MSDLPAFDVTVIPSRLQEGLPSGVRLRPLQLGDYERGHLRLLATLTQAPDIGREAWQARFKELVTTCGTYYPIVLVDDGADELVATGTLVHERKFIRAAGTVGHIEDIAVSPKMQGKGLGKKIIDALVAISQELGAYKASATILDCNPKNEAFYIKCGFETKGCEMARYNV